MFIILDLFVVNIKKKIYYFPIRVYGLVFFSPDKQLFYHLFHGTLAIIIDLEPKKKKFLLIKKACNGKFWKESFFDKPKKQQLNPLLCSKINQYFFVKKNEDNFIIFISHDHWSSIDIQC